MNQAGARAILVVALHRPHGGSHLGEGLTKAREALGDDDVDRFISQAAQLDLLANAELSLVRRSGRFVGDGKQAPDWLGRTLECLEAALHALAEDPAGDAAQRAAREHAVGAAREARQHTESDSDVVALASQARAMARDVLYVTGMSADQAGEALAQA